MAMTEHVTIAAADTAEDVVLSGATVKEVTVFNVTGANPVYVRFDGTAASGEAGDEDYVVPPSAWAYRTFEVGPEEGFTVSVISAGTETIRVEGA